MNARARSLAIAIVAALALGATPAFAALAGEVAQGRSIAAKLDAGTTSCSKLSDSEFEHLGEYVMERMVGSRAAHEAMNSRMEAMLGSARTDRMHEAIGRRFAACTSGTGGSWMMGGGMMSGSYGGWGAMMGSSDWSWMRGGGWRHMSRSAWQGAAARVMGPGMMVGASPRAWSGVAIAGTAIGALLLGGLIVLMVLRRPRRAGPSNPSTA